MIRITMTNSQPVEWQENEYTNYKYDGKFFIIIRNGEKIGFYNLDSVISIKVCDDKDDEKLIDDKTTLGWPLPNINNKLTCDVERMRETFNLIDASIREIQAQIDKLKTCSCKKR